MAYTPTSLNWDTVRSTFATQISEIENLLSIYEFLEKQTPPQFKTQDILNSSVVFLYATMENFIRSIEIILLPQKNLSEIDLYFKSKNIDLMTDSNTNPPDNQPQGGDPKQSIIDYTIKYINEKNSAQRKLRHQIKATEDEILNQTLKQIIQEIIMDYIDKSSYSTIETVMSTLSFYIRSNKIQETVKRDLMSIMGCRHHFAHKGTGGIPTIGKIQIPIKKTLIESWIQSLNTFFETVMNELHPPAPATSPTP